MALFLAGSHPYEQWSVICKKRKEERGKLLVSSILPGLNGVEGLSLVL